MSLFSKALRAGEGKNLKLLEDLVGQVNDLEASTEALSDDELRAKTVEFRQRLANGATLDEVEPEAYAVVREAAKRVLGQRHYDVQIVGAGGVAPRHDRRDEDWRGQDTGFHHAGVPQWAVAAGRSRCDGE